ncbi:MAG: aminopeptidase [candidate division KSB1 bacterium]|nr:aminopeptidase [candidate division KSB1 bacterium]
MQDPRYDRLAEVIVSHSTRLQPDENILIEATDVPSEMVIALIRRIKAVGAHPFVSLKQNAVLRELYRCESEQAMRLAGEFEAVRMRKMHAYVGLRGSFNAMEFSDVSPAGMKLYQTHWLKPVHLEVRVPKTKWVVLRWPHPSMAQSGGMSSEAFEEFYFTVCTLDYAKMSQAMDAPVARMQKTDRVRIIGPGTDLSFSIKGMPAIKCAGERNLPDGEVFTAPLRESVEGVIRYTAKTIYQGVVHEGVTLEFQRGRIIRASSDKSDHLNEVLDTDEGARYIGEFSLGVNPFITRPMLDILFDEKISGSFHLTPGAAYENEADNGNRSSIHWDMVCIQTPEYGGGDIYFDDQLIRRDGRFVTEDLSALNPENLN